MTQTVTETRYARTDLEQIDGTPVSLNLGCGEDSRGVGIDIHYSPDIEHDLNDGIPVADDAADQILANHVLEHLHDPTQFFREARRALRDDGELHLEVPNVAWFPVRLWITQDLQRFWSHKDPDREGHWLARRLGNTDDRRTAHRTLWTKQLLAEYLERNDFEYDIDGWHASRNLTVRAWPATGEATGASTLHELERSAGGDLASQDYWAQTRARILTRRIREQSPDSILDAGCGSGYLTEVLARETGATVTGVDISEESIAVARTRETDAEFYVADVTEPTPWRQRYDAVLFADVLEHFEDPTPVLCEARDALTPGGSIYLSLPAHDWLWGPHDEHNDHHTRYDADSVGELAELSGLSVAQTRYTNTVPLLPYWLYQRVLKRPVPDGARGGHSRVVETVKRALIGAEVRVRPPVGVTVMAELAP